MAQGSAQKIFSGVVWSILTNVVNALYGFIAIPILINYFGKAEYGLIALATSVNAYMQLMDMGLGNTNVRFFAEWLAKGDKSKVNKLFQTSNSFYGVVGIVNFLILIVVYIFAERIFQVTPEQCVILKQLLLLLSFVSIVNWYTSCFNQLIQATENVAWIQKRNLFTKILMIVSLVITIVLKFSLITYFICTILSSWVLLPFVIKKIKSLTPFVSFKIGFDWSVFKQILPYSLNIFAFSIFSLSYQNLRPVLLGIRSSIESVTDFGVINAIVSIVTAVSGVFMAALLPSSSKSIANGNKEAFNRIAYQGTKFITIFLAFCVFGMLSIAEDLLTVYVGPTFLYLVPYLDIMVLLLLSNHILAISSLILGGSNIKPLTYMTAVSSILALATAWLTIPAFSIGGVVLSGCVYTILQQLFYYLYYWPKVMHISSTRIFLRILLPVIAFGCAIWIGIENFIPNFDNHWLNIIVKGVSFTVIFAIITFVYLEKGDKEFIFRLILRKQK